MSSLPDQAAAATKPLSVFRSIHDPRIPLSHARVDDGLLFRMHCVRRHKNACARVNLRWSTERDSCEEEICRSRREVGRLCAARNENLRVALDSCSVQQTEREAVMKSLASIFVRLCSLLIVIGAGVMALAQSDTQYKTEVLKQLRLVEAEVMVQLGVDLQPTHQVYYVDLSNNTYQEISYTLYAGNSYIFIGACDNDCQGLQLKLYDGYHRLIDTGKPSALPVVATDVGSSGTFYLRVTMRSCSVEPCWAGVGVYK